MPVKRVEKAKVDHKMKYKISAVNYLNSRPFIYGLENTGIKNEIELQLDIPSTCAKKLEENKVDIGLVPVAILPSLDEYYIVSDYCIGADGEVSSVLLLSDVPLNEITTVLLDNQSRTSVVLVQVLAEKYWGITPRWEPAKENYESRIGGTVAGVVIGDRTFSIKHKYKFSYDLAAEWKKFTQLPFVFACWVSNKKLPDDFILRLNNALTFGLQHKKEIITGYSKQNPLSDVKDYFEDKISFDFNEDKKKSLQLFLGFIKELKEPPVFKNT